MKKVLQIIGGIALFFFIVWLYLKQEHRAMDADKKYKETEKKYQEVIKNDEKKDAEIKKLYEKLDKKEEEISKIISEKNNEISKIHIMSDDEIRKLENSNKSIREKYATIKKDRTKVVQKNIALQEQIENKDKLLKIKDEKIITQNIEIINKNQTILELKKLITDKDVIYWSKKPKVIGHGITISAIYGFDGKLHFGGGYGIYIDVKQALKRIF